MDDTGPFCFMPFAIKYKKFSGEISMEVQRRAQPRKNNESFVEITFFGSVPGRMNIG